MYGHLKILHLLPLYTELNASDVSHFQPIIKLNTIINFEQKQELVSTTTTIHTNTHDTMKQKNANSKMNKKQISFSGFAVKPKFENKSALEINSLLLHVFFCYFILGIVHY